MVVEFFLMIVIGSLFCLNWVWELIFDCKCGQIFLDDVEDLFDCAIELVIILQECVGLQEIIDGEWCCESYVKVFVECVCGFEYDLNFSGGLWYFVVVVFVEYYCLIVVDEV